MDKSEVLSDTDIFTIFAQTFKTKHKNDRHSKMPQVWQ